MSEIQFTKMVASGNDFVVLDAARLKTKVKNFGALAKEACDRKFGIGADGLLVLEKSKSRRYRDADSSAKADFTMRIFNPDGSEPTMCGNGARCAALFFKTGKPANRQTGKLIKFETKAGLLEAEVKKDMVKLKMTEPRDLWPNIDLSIGTQFYKVHYINTGVPHAVFFVGNVDTINVKEVGKQIRFHKHFHPEGANADFAQASGANAIKVRTYERGVEDETLACGTGSVASALTSFYLKLTKKSPVSVETKSGEVLKVYFDYKKDKFVNVWLEGGARVVYTGEYRPLASK